MLSSLILASLACQKSGGSEPSQSAVELTAGAAAYDPEAPAFGNTAKNIAKLKALPPTTKFSFTFMGDNRNSSPFSHDGEPIYQKVIAKINQLNPTFAVNSGDFTFEGLPTHWKRFEQITAAVKVPFLTVIGNHDALFRRTYYEQNYTPPNPETGLDDYSFEFGNTRFIALDDANRTITPLQYTWLHKQLTTLGVQNTIFMAHIPPSVGSWSDPINLTPPDSSHLIDLLAADHASLAMLSHAHIFDGSVSHKGVPYVISGGAGAPLDKGGLHHVTHVMIDGTHITWRMIPVADHEGMPEIVKQVR